MNEGWVNGFAFSKVKQKWKWDDDSRYRSVAENRTNARVCIEQVNGRVAVQRTHDFVVKLVVSHAVLVEVKIFDGAVAHGFCGGLNLGIRLL